MSRPGAGTSASAAGLSRASLVPLSAAAGAAGSALTVALRFARLPAGRPAPRTLGASAGAAVSGVALKQRALAGSRCSCAVCEMLQGVKRRVCRSCAAVRGHAALMTHAS